MERWMSPYLPNVLVDALCTTPWNFQRYWVYFTLCSCHNMCDIHAVVEGAAPDCYFLLHTQYYIWGLLPVQFKFIFANLQTKWAFSSISFKLCLHLLYSGTRIQGWPACCIDAYIDISGQLYPVSICHGMDITIPFVIKNRDYYMSPQKLLVEKYYLMASTFYNLNYSGAASTAKAFTFISLDIHFMVGGTGIGHIIELFFFIFYFFCFVFSFGWIPEEQNDINNREGLLYFCTVSLYLKDAYLHFNVWQGCEVQMMLRIHGID